MQPSPATPPCLLPRVLLLATGLALALAACSASSPDPQPEAGPVAGSGAAAEAASADDAGPAGAEPALIEADDPTDQQGACTSGPVQSLVGQQADEALVAEAMALSGSTSVRVLKPGDAATMDYRADRLNILTDDQGVVQSFNCG